jgi:predicted permease
MARGRRSEQDFADEIAAHVEIEADRLMLEGVEGVEGTKGMDRAAALAAARRAFGNMTRSRERFYEARRWMWLDHLRRDLRHALIEAARTPVATAIVVLSFALGVGFNTAIFSLADQALVRGLPVARPDQLVMLDWHGDFVGGGVGTDNLFPYPFYAELRRSGGVFAEVFARHPTDVHLAVGRGDSEPVAAEVVSGSYFPALGVRPALGRLLGDADDLQPGGHPVVVLSYDYWRGRLGGDPGVVGRRVLVNSFPMVVVGVAAPGFRGVDWGRVPALWVPLMMKRQATPSWDALLDRRTRWLHVFGRLRPGVSPRQAKARLDPWFKSYLSEDTRSEGWPRVSPQELRQFLGSTLDLLPAAGGRSDLRGRLRQPIVILLAATALLLVLACLNVANLSLAKALARHRPTALRVALGASRGRILAQQATESALLAAAGTAAGLLLAPAVCRAILSLLPDGAGSVALRADLDPRVLGFAAALTVLTALVSGVGPALYATAIHPAAVLKQRGAAASAGGRGVRQGLVVAQFALALILLVGAGLFARTLSSLRQRGPGFSTSNLLMFRIAPMSNGYDAARSKPLVRRLLAAVQQQPDVAGAGVARWEMLAGGGWNNPVTVQAGRRFVTEDLAMDSVSPGFFAMLGVPVVRGRDFDQRDAPYEWDGDRRSAIVNEEFVRRYLGHDDPLGARLGIGDGPATATPTQIVGVVRNFQDTGLRRVEPEIFFALWEGGVREAVFYVRTRTASPVAARSLRALVRRIDPALTVLALRTLDDELDRLLSSERILATLAAAFAAVATLLAMIGLYGVLSFSAASRAREIGIRLALGAPRRAAGGLILREAALLAAAGAAVAVPAAWALGRLVEAQLFGVRPLDAASLAAAAVILALVCLAAGAVPAGRASAVNPLDTMRGE